MNPKDLVSAMPLTDDDIEEGKRGARILCLDGGGSRGLAQVQILEEIEKRTGKNIIQLFDLICGTSTGGIIALSIVSKVPLSVLKLIYQESHNTIFGEKSVQKSLNVVSYSCLYNVGILRKMIKNTAPNIHIREIRWPKVFVTACDATNPNDLKLHLFSSYKKENNVFITDAAVATSSAPIYYPPAIIDGKTFRDGGLKANNPTEIAIQQANEIWGPGKIDCIVSIGTGEKIDQIEEIGPFPHLLKSLIASIGNSSDVHDRITANIGHTYTFKYFRLSPPEVGSLPLDPSEAQLTELQKKTTLYIQQQANVFTQIKNCLQ